MKQYNVNLKEEIATLTKSLLQSNEVITTVLSEIQVGSKSSMMSLHNLINALETKISILLKQSGRFLHSRNPNLVNLGHRVAQREEDDINVLKGSPKNMLQDTHVFLKQAMDTLRNSSIRMKGFLEPVDEEEKADDHPLQPYPSYLDDKH